MFSIGKKYGDFSIDNIIYKNKNRTCVIFASSLPNGEKVAVKCVSKKQFAKQIRNETKVFNAFKSDDSNLIVKCLSTFSNANRKCFVLKYAEAGDLFSYIQRRESISEDSVKKIMFRVLSSVSELHSKGFMHQDIKPENIFLDGDESMAVLGDFGSAEKIKDGELSNSILETLFYLAPEVLKMKPHDKSVDIWSIGVIMYLLLTGELPFFGNDLITFLNDMENRVNKLANLPELRNVSDDAKDLIIQMLKINPEERISASEALKSEWFNDQFFYPSMNGETFEKIINQADELSDHSNAV